MIDLKNKIYVEYKNIISKEISNKLELIMSGNNFPWFYQDNTVSDESDYFKNKKFKKYDTGQFTHIFVNSEKINSPFFNEVYNILQIFSKKTNTIFDILRCKANMQLKKNNKKHNIPHKDMFESHLVLIYYVNDSDGDTILFDKNYKIVKKIKPEKGKFLLFDGDILHASSPPVKSKKRMIINLNIKIKK